MYEFQEPERDLCCHCGNELGPVGWTMVGDEVYAHALPSECIAVLKAKITGLENEIERLWRRLGGDEELATMRALE